MIYLRAFNAVIFPLALVLMSLDPFMKGDWIGGLFLLCSANFAGQGAWKSGRD